MNSPLDKQWDLVGRSQIELEHAAKELRLAFDELDPLVATKLKALVDSYGAAYVARQTAAHDTVRMFGAREIWQRIADELTPATGQAESGGKP